MQEEQMANKDVANQMIEHAKKIVEQMRYMTEKYGADWLEKLPDFNGSILLKEYQDKVYDIEKLSCNNNNKMTHLLYHMMNQHSFSFSGITNKLSSKTNKINNLLKSYERSIEIAEKLNNDSKSYAWYSNMKKPTTYIGSPSVIKHYKKMSEIFEKLPLVKVRRMHLFYESMLQDSDNEKNKGNQELSALFTILLVEFFMGVESKVVIVKDATYSDYQDFFYDFQSNITSDKGYLLDFALYHNEMRDYQGVYNGNYISLFANFCYEKAESSFCNEKVPLSNQHESQKVYEIMDYNVFHLLRNYYISLWEKDNYIKYIQKSELTISQIKSIEDCFKRLDVVDFRDFLDKYLPGKELKNFFDNGKFGFLYKINMSTTKRFEKYKAKYEKLKTAKANNTETDLHRIENEVNDMIRKDIFVAIDRIRDVSNVENLEEYFQDFLIRDKKDTLQNQLEELYNLYGDDQQSFYNSLNEFVKTFIK